MPSGAHKYYSMQVNYYARLDDSDNNAVTTVPTSASESHTDSLSDEEAKSELIQISMTHFGMASITTPDLRI